MSQGIAPHKSLFGCRSIKVLVFVLNLTLYLFYKQFLRNEILMLEILLLFAYISLSLSLSLSIYIYIYICVCVCVCDTDYQKRKKVGCVVFLYVRKYRRYR